MPDVEEQTAEGERVGVEGELAVIDDDADW